MTNEYRPAFTARLLAGVSVGILWYSVVSIAVVVAAFLLTQRVDTVPWIETGAAIALSLTLGAVAVGYYVSRRISSQTEETTVRVWTVTFVLTFGGVFVTASILTALIVPPDFIQLTVAYGGVHLAAVTIGLITAQWRSRKRTTKQKPISSG